MLEQQGASILTVVNSKRGGSSMDLSKNYFGRQTEIALDLKSEADRDFLLSHFISEVDVLLESYRPGVMEKLGLSPEVVHGVNPKVIYGRLSGFG
jgi:alpha-methylacyl-CoA racemase